MKILKRIFILAISLAIFSNISFGDEINLNGYSLKDINGKEYIFASNSKPTYVELWASWCPYCFRSLKDLDALSKEAKDYEVVTVIFPNRNREKNLEDFKKWFNTLNYKNIKVLVDEKGQLLKKFKVKAYPTLIFLDSNGKSVLVRVGYHDIEEVKKDIQKILK